MTCFAVSVFLLHEKLIYQAFKHNSFSVSKQPHFRVKLTKLLNYNRLNGEIYFIASEFAFNVVITKFKQPKESSMLGKYRILLDL